MLLQLFAAAVAGVASHLLYFIHGEFHLRAPKVARFYLVAFVLVAVFETNSLDSPLLHAVIAASCIAGTYASALFASMLIYRSFFHKLRQFPGPPLAKLTKFYHAYKVRDFKQCVWLHEVHEKYGDFVRTGPSEVTCFTPDAIPHILGPQSKCRKSMWWEMMWPEISMATTRDSQMHASRRRAWDRGFSVSALKAQEPYLSEHVEGLCNLIASKQGQEIDFTDIFSLFAFDVMGDINYGFKFDMVKDGKINDWLILFKKGALLFGPATPLPWLFHVAVSIPGLQKDWLTFKAWSNGRLTERLAIEPEKKDVMTFAIEHAKSDPVLGAEMRHHWLLSDFITLILAASEPVISTTVFLMYHITRNPEHLVRLRQELATIEDITEHSQLQNLAHFNAIIDETLRLHPSVPSGGLRDTPPEGITIGTTYIPGNTTVLIPHYTLGRREDCYQKPLDFIPERWTTRPEMVKNREAFIPFQNGSKHQCLGMHLAKMEIRLAVARLVSRFDFEFAPGETGTDVSEQIMDLFTTAPGPLRLVFKERDVMA